LPTSQAVAAGQDAGNGNAGNDIRVDNLLLAASRHEGYNVCPIKCRSDLAEEVAIQVFNDMRIRQPENSDATNFLELRVYGLMRSGNHPIIEWIQQQHYGSITCHLNNVAHGDCDPYKSFTQVVVTGMDASVDLDTLRKLKKRLLIYSYEDRDHLEIHNIDFLTSVFHQDFQKNRVRYLGTSEHQFDVLIIRDPFNCLASRIKLHKERGSQGGVNDIAVVLDNWKRLAKEAVAIRKAGRPDKIVITFNQWLRDIEYRRELSRKLLGCPDDSSMNRISTFGGGSSFSTKPKLTLGDVVSKWYNIFDFRRYREWDQYAKRLIMRRHCNDEFLERWMYFLEDENYRKLLSDREIIDLSQELFGEIKGTREFLNGNHHCD